MTAEILWRLEFKSERQESLEVLEALWDLAVEVDPCKIYGQRMKSKRRACKAKVSKIPSDSSSMAARVLSEIWIFERIPLLGKLRCYREDAHIFPPILKWKDYRPHLRSKILNEKLFGKRLELEEEMVLTELEKAQQVVLDALAMMPSSSGAPFQHEEGGLEEEENEEEDPEEEEENEEEDPEEEEENEEEDDPKEEGGMNVDEMVEEEGGVNARGLNMEEMVEEEEGGMNAGGLNVEVDEGMNARGLNVEEMVEEEDPEEEENEDEDDPEEEGNEEEEGGMNEGGLNMEVMDEKEDGGMNAGGLNVEEIVEEEGGLKVEEMTEDRGQRIEGTTSHGTKSDLSVSKLEGLKQDCNQFILQKRADVPSCSRKQDLIPEGCHASAASLMERSGLAGENEDHSRMDVDGGGDIDSYAATEGMYQHGAAKRLKGNKNDVQKAHLAGPHHGNPLSEAKDAGEHNIVPGISYGSDGHHDLAPDSSDEMVVAAKKHRESSSDKTLSQVSLETDWTEQGLCIKCDKGDQVLTCSDSGCPIAVHENCMRCSASFDDMGNFYCPYCSYKRAVAEYCQARKKAALAKKSLSLFIDINMMNAHQPKQAAETIKRKESNQSSMAGDGIHLDETHENRQCGEILSNQSVQAAEDNQQAEAHETSVCLSRGGNHAQQDDDPQCWTVVQDQQQAEPSIAHCGDEVPCVEGETTLDGETLHLVLTEGKRVNAKTFEENLHIREGEQMQACESSISLTRNRDDEQQLDNHQHRKVVMKRLQEPSIAYDGEHQNAEDITFSKSGLRPAKRFSNPGFINLRRKKLHWTAEEEEMLREGVQKFSTAANKNYPWRKILDFGRHVFDGTRTPVDLKDKWRNILGREGSRGRSFN
ncbi:hypothetical protein HHK36_002313 [Tetracentron sinense]|uniref:Myb-like domain-containing protein n=1 Tax=Tetracentron sinense TaxID=13715 RepID=A0A834ZVI7_TETSI|nr:hypothetical protein HHK36_002313 [Tetracentron sinense]